MLYVMNVVATMVIGINIEMHEREIITIIPKMETLLL
jgi:hypothetical protein